MSSASDAKAAIEAEFRRRTKESARWHDEAARAVPGGVTRSVAWYGPYPLCMASGAGCRLEDIDGNQYLDHLSNFGSMIHGHAHPTIVAAVTAQVARGTDFGAPNREQLALAQAIMRRVPSVERIRFATSGSEAVSYALRAARAFTGRPKILKMEGSYHGGFDSVQVSVDPGAGAPDFPLGAPSTAGVLPEVSAHTLVAPYNDAARASAIIREHGTDLAAVIVEAVTVRGMIAADPAFLRAVREAARAVGALFILDEVVTFRLAPGGAQSLAGITPDLTTFGKIIGGGLPVGAFGGRADVLDAFDPSRAGALPHSGTFTGNAAVAAGGLASLDLLDDEAIAHINTLGDSLRAGLRRTFDAAGVAAQITGSGSLVAFHLCATPVRDYRSSLAADRDAARWLHLALLNRGVFARSTGAFFLSTPMGDAEIAETLTAFEGALDQVRPIISK